MLEAWLLLFAMSSVAGQSIVQVYGPAHDWCGAKSFLDGTDS